MVQAVTGFLASDGRFFHDEVQAETYDAELVLVAQITRLRFKPEQVLQLIQTAAPAIRRYLDALEALPEEEEPSDTTGNGADGTTVLDEDNFDQDDDTRGEEDEETVLELPPGVREPVSDVGRSILATTVPIKRKVHGPGMRRGNASGVRSGADMAVVPRRRKAQTRDD